MSKLLCKLETAPAPFARGFCVFSQSTAKAQTSQQTASAWRSWAATSAAVAGLAYVLHESNGPARCLTPPTKQDEVTFDAPTEQLLRWLPAVGAEVDAIDVKKSQSVRTSDRMLKWPELLMNFCDVPRRHQQRGMECSPQTV